MISVTIECHQIASTILIYYPIHSYLYYVVCLHTISISADIHSMPTALYVAYSVINSTAATNYYLYFIFYSVSHILVPHSASYSFEIHKSIHDKLCLTLLSSFLYFTSLTSISDFSSILSIIEYCSIAKNYLNIDYLPFLV